MWDNYINTYDTYFPVYIDLAQVEGNNSKLVEENLINNYNILKFKDELKNAKILFILDNFIKIKFII